MARIASRQHGVVSRVQLLALGVSPQFVARLVAAGRLHPLHLGVYAVGHTALTTKGRWMAAVLAGGRVTVLSHLSAALLWEILTWTVATIHVSDEVGHTPSRPGLSMHRTRRLPPDDRSEIDGIPVTSLNRTLIDCAGMLSRERLRYVVEAADRRGLLHVPSVLELCDESRGRRGVGGLRRLVLEERGAAARTKSPPETLFLRRSIRHGLPEPIVNSRLHGYEVDFHWPRAGLVVEIDTYTYHRSWGQRRRDLQRDADLRSHGIEVVRLTPEMIDAPETFPRLEALIAVDVAPAV